MKLAFLHKNFTSLSLEHKVVCLGNLATALLCFFPWYSEDPNYGDSIWKIAFQGPSFLIGTTIFLLAAVILFYFVDILWERKKLRFRFSVDWGFLAISAQQLLLIVLAWSVLYHFASQSHSANIRFGIFIVFLSQFASFIASILSLKGGKKQEVKEFFQTPPPARQNTVNSYEAPKEQSLL